MTKRPLSTIWSNISLQQSNVVRLLQMWVMSLMLVWAEAQRNFGSNHFCQNRPDGSYDFFYFVLQWPGSFCSRGCCFDRQLPLPASQFTIHGLWPAHVGGKSPCFCKAPNNPGPNKPKPEGLWQHEWTKHGSCSGMDRLTYFQTAIDLHTDYNVLEFFHFEGIYPDGQMYDLLDLHQILKNYIGEEPIITCTFNDMYQVYQIYEVYICLDKFRLLPSPCPNAATFQTKCRTPDALFPEFNPLVQLPSCPFQPPRQMNTPVSYCTNPSLLALDESNPSAEESLENYLDSVDSELASDHDKFQTILGNNALDLDGELGFV